jgi:hypothetical protein
LFYFIPISDTLSDVVTDCAFSVTDVTVEDITGPPIEDIGGKLGESDAMLGTGGKVGNDGRDGNFGKVGNDGRDGNFGKEGRPILNDFTIPPILPIVFCENSGFLTPPTIPSNPDGIFILTFGISIFGTGIFGISILGISGTASFGASIVGMSSFGRAGIFGTVGSLGIDIADGSAGALGKLIAGIFGADIAGMGKLDMLFCF